jgi:NTE family protein
MGDVGAGVMSPSPDKHAVVLSGGAAYGAFEVGVMKVLFSGHSPSTGYQPVRPDIFTGTSVGAFNASMMVSKSGEDSLTTVLGLERLWLEELAGRAGMTSNGIYRVRGDPFEYFDGPIPMPAATGFLADDAVRLGRYVLSRSWSFLASSANLSLRLVQAVDLSAFVSAEPFYNLVRRVVDSAGIVASNKQLRIIAANWISGEIRVFENSDFADRCGCESILASAAIPGIFPPVPIGGDLYVDGGTVLNTPLDPAIAAGANVLHVIYLNPQIENIPMPGQPNTVDTMLRVFAIMLATKIAEDIATARWINEGIRTVEQSERGGVPAAGSAAEEKAAKKFVRVANQLLKHGRQGYPYRKLTIHRYFPERELGSSMGMLDFRLDTVLQIIQDGEQRTLTHDCIKAGCIQAD